MNLLYILLIIFIFAISTVVITFVVLPAAKRKDIDVKAALDRTANAVATVTKALDTIKPFIKDSVDTNILDKIAAAAHAGVGSAEQLYHIGQLEPGERLAESQNFALMALKIAGVEDTPEVRQVLEGVTQAAVNALGHKASEKPPDETQETAARLPQD